MRKIYLCLILVGLYAALSLRGCITQQSADTEPKANMPAATTLPQEGEAEKKAEVVSVEDGKLVFSFPENSAIPYRWQALSHSDAITLVDEYTKELPSFALAAGDSPTEHVFIYEWSQDGEAELEFVLAYIEADTQAESIAENAGIAVYSVSRSGESIDWQAIKEDYIT